MRELNINELTSGSKLINVLRKSLPSANDSFFYKMLRKKNITLNKKKATGVEKVCSGDVVTFFLSDETYDKFAGKCSANESKTANVSSEEKNTARGDENNYKINRKDIVYEDRDIILINKPYGVLSQKAEQNDYSMVEAIYDYMVENGELSPDDIFRPSVTNRLDRNTTGIIAGGKTTAGLQYLSNAQKDNKIKKYYICIVCGKVTETKLLNGLWKKNSRNNKVTIDMVETIPGSYSFPDKYWIKGNVPAQTLIAPIVSNDKYTVVKIGLLTGKTHQIRAHMKAYGHPLIGDYKYGDRTTNDYFKRKYGLESQLLHAYIMDIDGRGEFVAKLPSRFVNILKGERLYSESIEEVYKNIELRP